MAKKPYCIIPEYITIPEMNYREAWAYVTLKEAQATVKAQWGSEIYKFTFDKDGNAVSCKMCNKGK